MALPAMPKDSTARIEVYRFPADCLFIELKEHYEQEPYLASCITCEESAYNSQTGTFILEFASQEAEQILAHPSQLLDEDDEDSMIFVRPYTPPVRQLLVNSGTKAINARFLKKCFTKFKFGDWESCVPHEDSQHQWIVTFSDAKDASTVARLQTLQISANVQVDVQLYQPTSGDLSVPLADELSSPVLVNSLPTSESIVNPDLSAAPQQTEVQGHDLDLVTASQQTEVQGHNPDLSAAPQQTEVQGHDLDLVTASQQTEVQGHNPDLSAAPQQTEVQGHNPDLSAAPQQTVVQGHNPDLSAASQQTEVQGHNPDLPAASQQTEVQGHNPDLSAAKQQTEVQGHNLHLKETPQETEVQPLYSSNDVVRDALSSSSLSLHITSLPGLPGHAAERKAECEVTTAVAPSLQCPTHIEVQRFQHEQANDMYQLLTLHIEQFATNSQMTKFTQSYDSAKDVFRFDLKPQEIEKLTSSGALLFEEDANSALSITACTSGRTVMFHRLDKIKQITLTSQMLHQHFGESSSFCALMDIVHLQPCTALIQMESCSVASLVVSIGKHVLDNKIELQASFPSAALSAQVADNPSQPLGVKEVSATSDVRVIEPPKNSLMIETKVSSIVLKKCVRSKSKGRLTRELGNGRYVAEYDTEEDAQKVVDQQVLDCMGSKVTARFFTPDEAELLILPSTNTELFQNEKKDIHLPGDGFHVKPLRYDREFLLGFRNYRDLSSFCDVKFPPHLVAKPNVSPRKPTVAARLSSPLKDQDEPGSDPTNARNSALTTLLVSNILDFDEQTLYFWVKSALHVWPHSIQVSANEEEAIVKVPTASQLVPSLSNNEHYESASPHLLLHGERLQVEEIQPACAIQVICSNSQPGVAIDADTIDAYFSNERYTGVKNSRSLQSVEEKTTYNDLPVYVVTYSTSQDAQTVINRNPHRHSKWTFHVAEYFKDIDVCALHSLWVYKNIHGTLDEKVKGAPLIRILNADQKSVDSDLLKMFMSDRKRANGGAISSWKVRYGVPSVSIEVVYEDVKVAERVYDWYKKNGLRFRDTDLELELEIPWLTKVHDDHKVRVSGLTNDLDPEKLKFYLSAISDNVVVDIFFDERQTRAVAMFADALDYGSLISHQSAIPLKGCNTLRLSQEYKCKDLIATGAKLTKEDIELPLERLLSGKFNREVDVCAEELPGTANMWRITTEPEALPCILREKGILRHCESLGPHSSFLGLYVTSGVHRKSKELSTLISDEMVLGFVIGTPAGYEMLDRYLQCLGIVLSKDGVISINPHANKRDTRVALGNWKSLKPSLERFIGEKLQVYKTEALTQQIYERVAAEVPRLVADLPLVTATNTAGQSTGNVISVVGERVAVEDLKVQLLQLIAQYELELEEEVSVKDFAIPNIPGYQIEYMKQYGFFNKLLQQYQLKGIESDTTTQMVTLRGVPHRMMSAQKEMLVLLPKLFNSKQSMQRKSIFIKVLSTESAISAVRKQLLADNLVAVWTVENKTISVYSASIAVSRAALNTISNVIWEAQHPANHQFDDLELRLLESVLWKDKKLELQELYHPLEIVECENSAQLSLAGLAYNRASVFEDIPFFFDKHVKRTTPFPGVRDRLVFMWKFRSEVFHKLEDAHHVTIGKLPGGDVTLTGTKDEIANGMRALKQEHDSICKVTHPVENQAMIQHINDDTEFLDNVGLKNKCLVVEHREEAVVATIQSAVRSQQPASAIRCKVKLTRSGAQCVVRRGDITAMSCDVIVNAANGDLQHVGGLALAIVQKGGSSIQQECFDHVRKNGQLMEGQVFTSSAGSLKCKKIIHAVGPRWRGGSYQEDHTLFSCIDNCFEEARIHNFTSIAIPPISTGIFGFPLEQAVATIVEAMHERDRRGDTLPQQIIFIDNKDDSLQLFEKELMSGNKKPKSNISQPAPLQRPSAKPRAAQPSSSGVGNYQVNGRTVIIAGRTNIEIRHGDISLSQEESLVNSVGSRLNLGNGQVAKAIAARAGPQLQAACSAIGQLQACQVEPTDAFALPCKKVLHCVCPNWRGHTTTQALKKVVNRCLKLAASFNHQSIAFPALGTGNLKYPGQEVARGMIEAVIDYTMASPNSSVLDVKIVVYGRDVQTQQSFDDELQRLKNAKAPARNMQPKGVSPVSSSSSAVTDAVKGSLVVNNTTIRVMQGDITTCKADVLVNSTDSSMNMNGGVSQALLAKAGLAVEDEIAQLAQTQASGGLWISGAGNLDASHIFHIDGHSVRWETIITNCLRRCDADGLSSIAFPAIGTGNLGQSAKKMAELMLAAAVTYIDKHSNTVIERIDVVIFQKEMVEEFVMSMKKCIDQKPSFLARVKLKFVKLASSIFSGATGAQTEPNHTPQRYNFNADLIQSSGGVLELDIYGQNEVDINVCRQELRNKLDKAIETLLWNNKPSYAEDRETISMLSDKQVENLRGKAAELKVGLEIDQRLQNIKVVGLSRNVMSMSEYIVVELKKIEKEALKKREEVLIAKTVQWEYEETNGTWVKFHPSVNKDLEDAYTKNQNGEYTYDTNQEKVTLSLAQMTGQNSTNQFKIRRNDLSKSHGEMVALPTTWQVPTDVYQEFPLIPATQEYRAVEKEFMGTLGAGGNAVLEIRRIQNPTLYQHYVILRKDAAKRLGKPEDQVEKTLWHGTDEDTVRKIAGGKFDRAMSGKNATMYGSGSYFATTSAYSSRYAPASSQGHRYMIQTRVITGEWCQGSQQLRAAPYKPNKIDQYDSVVDDTNQPTIFVVFHDASAYPAYIIKFQ